jgi:hypothetical protein
MSKWQRRRILILGKTYPNYSRKHLEVACTGGLLEPTMEMVRLYPIPFRYLQDSSKFTAWQYIEADVTKDLSDPRPESYNIRHDTIEPRETISPDAADQRCKLLEQSPHFFSSVEELLKRNESHATSLGTIKPREILGISVEPRTEYERDEWEQKEVELFAQKTLLGPEPRKIDFPEAKFFVKWKCADGQCTTPHKMSLHDWGIHELYRKLHGDPNGQAKLRDQMLNYLDQRTRDVYFYLGNFRGTMFNFGLMAAYSATKQRQSSLF